MKVRLLGTALAAILATTGLTAVAPASHAAVTSTPQLPFDLPSPSALRAQPKLVFAHYWDPDPISIDNQDPATDYYARHYLTTNGENGKHAAYGGLLRDRPIGRAPRTGMTETQWRVADMKVEVQQAVSAGLDGFALDILQFADGSDRNVAQGVQAMLQAAAQVDPGFKVMLMPDMSGSLVNKTPEQWADYLAVLASYSSAYRLSDGRLVISPFKGEAWTPAKWTEMFGFLQSKYGIQVAFVPVFLNLLANKDAFAPISYGMSEWGNRNPAWNLTDVTYTTSPRGRAKAVTDLGKLWMAPVSLQDERPNQGIYDEAANTQNLRDTWMNARTTGAQWVQIPTWNDYTEGAHIAPSAKHGYSFLDLQAYFVYWFKYGTAPAVTRDTIYLSHRTQLVNATPAYVSTKPMVLRGGTPARDTVEALTFLTAPGTVTVRVGPNTYTCAAPAGMSACTVPLAVGTVSASVTRTGGATTAVTSPNAVLATPPVQDYGYTAASSGRIGTVTPPTDPSPTPTPTVTLTTTPTPTPTPTPTQSAPATVVQSVTPVDDTYANAGAATTNYSTQASLASRGTIAARSYLRFALPVAPAGTTLTGASLTVRTTTDTFAGSLEPHVVQVASDTWSAGSLTWAAGQPAIDPAVVGTIDAPAPNAVVSTTLAADALAGSSGRTATLAVTNNGTDNLWWWSADHANASYRPQLTLTYSAAPTTTPTPAPTATATPTPTPTPTPTITVPPAPTPTPTPTASASPSPSASPSVPATPTPTPTATPTVDPGPSPTPTPTPSPTLTPTVEPTPEPAPSPAPSPVPTTTVPPEPVPTAPVLTSAAVLVGSPTVGSTMTASAGFTGQTTVTYQWLRDGKAISGATTSRYRAVTADRKHKLSARVTASNSVGSLTSTSVAVTVGSAGRVTSLAAPSLRGVASVGQTLTARTGRWSPSRVTYSYRWLRDGKAIKGADDRTHRVTRKDRGHRIAVRITAHSVGYDSTTRTTHWRVVKRASAKA